MSKFFKNRYSVEDLNEKIEDSQEREGKLFGTSAASLLIGTGASILTFNPFPAAVGGIIGTATGLGALREVGRQKKLRAMRDRIVKKEHRTGKKHTLRAFVPLGSSHVLPE